VCKFAARNCNLESWFCSFEDDEKLRQTAEVEEIVMEGANPKAPKFHIEHHMEAPREAYVQHVREMQLKPCRKLMNLSPFGVLAARTQSLASSKSCS